jgi:2-polyprenyl-3-methyl-5-hydroxy-6-metoxy-1,4-benzoquinol methylase
VRLGLRPEGLREWLALRLHRVPTPLGEGMFAMMACRALMAGVRLGLFAVLADAPAEPAALATRLAVDPGLLAALLDALAAGGWLRRGGTAYAVAPAALPWLDPRSPQYLGDLIAFNYDHWQWWSQLEAALPTGQPLDLHNHLDDLAAVRRYVLAMRALARLAAAAVVAAVRVPEGGPRRLLDVGGSHGAYAVAFCRRYPCLQATVVDLPPVAAVGEVLVAAEGLANRVRYQPGDATRDPLGEGYDLALLFDVLHHFPAPTARQLLTRTMAALRPGGVIALLEPAGDRADSQLAALLNLHYHLTSAGGVYPAAELQRWLVEAGGTKLRAHPLPQLPGLALLTGAHGT